MKIVAYSRIPASTPFVHLGYIAASTTTTRPIQGLLWGGVVIFIAGLSLIARRSSRQTESTEPAETLDRVYKLHRIGVALLLLSIAVICSAFAFGKKDEVFMHPEIETSDRIATWGGTVANRSMPDSGAGSIIRLPTQEGEYDLFSALKLPASFRKLCTDGWNTPLRLRAIQHEDQLGYMVVSAGPDRTLGTEDDLTSTELSMAW